MVERYPLISEALLESASPQVRNQATMGGNLLQRTREALSDLRDRPAGNIRIVASDHAINTVLWPKLRKILSQYPDIKVELARDNGLTDIVAERFDADGAWANSSRRT